MDAQSKGGAKKKKGAAKKKTKGNTPRRRDNKPRVRHKMSHKHGTGTEQEAGEGKEEGK